ncbi:restriction endonuclease subunit S [Catenovulum maritimum]|uniref:Type I restriction modification DNA specificity domain-containing protein n=1 Tax=Catenovulum maritimum TaxID=1513271 RepID=A0A0J8JQB6_9ALTE|nr:restriction endonuclease subunit S [Catenovulum maritimum]KMT66926.1 hypothetical protein XM47_02150 [Catenovulum maritimum]
MVNNWPTVTLEEVAKIKSGKRLPKGQSLVGYQTDYPYIRLVDISGGRIQTNELQYLIPETREAIKRYIVNADDICLAIVGHTIGMVFYITEEWDNVNLTENAARITELDESFHPKFIYYFLISNYGQSEIISRTVGSAQGKLPLYNIKSLPIPRPPKVYQDEIVGILDSISEKIKLNCQTSQTLEQMAQALFKSWFVDFDPVFDNALASGMAVNNFPEALQKKAVQRQQVQQQMANGELDAKPLPEDISQLFPSEFEQTDEPSVGINGWIPEGWKLDSFSKVATLKNKSIHPKKEPEKLWTQFSLPAFDDGKVPTHDLGIEIKSGKYKLSENTVLVSKLNPHTPRIWMPKVSDTDVSVCSTEFMPFEPVNNEHRVFVYSLMNSENVKSKIASRVTGTTGSHQRVSPKEVAVMPILLPSLDCITSFSNLIKSSFDKVELNLEQNIELTKLRDTLLPKLISGELQLPAESINTEVPA